MVKQRAADKAFDGDSLRFSSKTADKATIEVGLAADAVQPRLIDPAVYGSTFYVLPAVVPLDVVIAADVVTISGGVACVVPTAGAEPSELIASADKALYVAKDSGRNRIELFADELRQ